MFHPGDAEFRKSLDSFALQPLSMMTTEGGRRRPQLSNHKTATHPSPAESVGFSAA